MARIVTRPVLTLLLAGSLLLLSAGCRSVFRYPVEPQDAAVAPDTAIMAGMNPYILTNTLAERLVIEVDWVTGGRPHDDALAGLQRTLERYLPQGKELVIDVDDEIPLERWNAAEGDFLEHQAVLVPFLDSDPTATDYDLVWLIVVPGEERFLGWMTELLVERDGEPHAVDTVFLFRDSIEREAALWVTPRKVEQAILVHELGHVLGLVSGPDHIEKDNPRHCTEPGCVMAHHRARSQLYNAPAALFAGKIPDDYGDKCRRDIARAQELWSAAAVADPDFAATLERRREATELRAKACWFAARGDWLEAADRWRRAGALDGEGAATAEGEPVELQRLCAETATPD